MIGMYRIQGLEAFSWRVRGRTHGERIEISSVRVSEMTGLGEEKGLRLGGSPGSTSGCVRAGAGARRDGENEPQLGKKYGIIPVSGQS